MQNDKLAFSPISLIFGLCGTQYNIRSGSATYVHTHTHRLLICTFFVSVSVYACGAEAHIHAPRVQTKKQMELLARHHPRCEGNMILN